MNHYRRAVRIGGLRTSKMELGFSAELRRASLQRTKIVAFAVLMRDRSRSYSRVVNLKQRSAPKMTAPFRDLIGP